jgi:hypothetical protein
MKTKIKLLLISLLCLLVAQPVLAQRSRNLQQDTRFKQIGSANQLINCKSGTEVLLTNKSELIQGTLAEDSKIARPGWTETAVTFKANTVIEFYLDGTPKKGTLAETSKFIRFGTMNKRISFSANTQVELDSTALAVSGTLDFDEVLLNNKGIQKNFKKGQVIRFDTKGAVIEN